MPLERKQSLVGHMPNRSPSIMDILSAAQKTENHSPANTRSSPIAKPAPLDTFVFGEGHEHDAPHQKKQPHRSVSKTPQPLLPSALAQPSRPDDKVVMFPKELRKNRFFTSPELSSKATRFVVEGRRPSSVFSGAISDTCRQELEQLQRVQQLQLGTRDDIAGSPRNASMLRSTSSMLMQQSQQMQAANALLGGWQTDSHFLRHVESEDREGLPALEKLGRRLEYGKVLGMFREELIASKSTGKYDSVSRHKEVGGSKAPIPVPPLDWSHMDISDVPSLIDVAPRSGKAFPTAYAIAKHKQQEAERQKRRIQQQLEEATPQAKHAAVQDPKSGKPGAPANSPSAVSQAAPPAAPPAPLVGFVTSGPSTAPALRPAVSTSRFEGLRYCFGDKDAEKLLPSSMVIIKTKETTYAFTDGRRPRGIEGLLNGKGSLVSADGTIDINSCLQCMNQYDAPLVNLSRNSIARLDRLLANTLSTLLRTSLVKLDLSFNKIRFIEDEFFVPTHSHLTPLQVKEHISATAEKVAMLQEELANEPETSSLAEKRKEFFRRVRLVALTDLADPDAPQRLLFQSLRALYLHGNPLDSFEEVMKLTPLAATLQSLTFHGNDKVDREAAKVKNRRRLLMAFPSLVSLNFTTIIAGEEEEL